MIEINEAKKICRVQEQIELAKQVDSDEWVKYLTEDQFLEEKLEIFKIINLDTAKNARVLDIGAGIGHFGSLCKHFGHEYLGTYFGRTSEQLHPFFIDAGLLHIEFGLFSRHGKNIPKGPWDRIVMIRTTFELNAEWTIEDWQELVDECLDNLVSGGQLLIKSNLSVEKKSKYGKLETQCQERMMAAFPNKTPLPHTQWATWHWIKE